MKKSLRKPRARAANGARSRPAAQGRGSLREKLASFGPGIVTGAADDDPSGIATYSQVGARYGYGILWTTLFSFPLMVAIQQITAEVGRVTGRGVVHHMKKLLPMPLCVAVVAGIGVANVINVGADVAAMGAAVQMLIGGPRLLYCALLTAICLGLQIFIPYQRYANILKWSTLSLFTYFLTPFFVHVRWGEALTATVLPSGLFDTRYLTALTAVLGTTISPYLVLWQASQEVEEMAVRHAKPLRRSQGSGGRELRRIRADTLVGMAASNLIAYFIMLTCAAALHAHGVTNVETPEQVAEALRPIAGSFAFFLFAIGIIGTGLLAVPVLAGATAYGLAELFGWKCSLEARWDEAKPFYGILATVVVAGLAIAAAPINPMKALYASAIINGIAAVPAIAATVWIATSPKVMGKKFAVTGRLRALGWLTAAVMFGAAVGSIVDFVG